MTILAWLSRHLRALLGLDWIEEARDIAETSRHRQNMIAEQLRRSRGEGVRDGQ